MGAHIPVDGGDFFWGGILLEGKGEGVGAFRHWIFVSFFASCLCGCWGPFFLFGGGGGEILLEGEGGVGGAFRQWMCCAFFVAFV